MERLNKKIYKTPKMVTHTIDTEISLVMSTGEGEAPGGPRSQSVETESFQQNNFESNPFEEKQ